MKRAPEGASAEELGLDPRGSFCSFFSCVSLITDCSEVLFQMFLFWSTFKYQMFFFSPLPLFFIILRKLQCVFQGWWVVMLIRDRRVKSNLALPSVTKPRQGLTDSYAKRHTLFNFLSSLPVKQQNSFTFIL